MAQGDLLKILQQSIDIIKKRDIRAEMATFPHEYEVSARQIEKEILVQIENIKLTQRGDVRTKGTGKVATQPVRVLYGMGAGLTQEQSQAELDRIAEGNELTDTQRKKITELANEFAENCYKFAMQAAAGSKFSVERVSGSGTEYTLRVNQLGTPTPKNNPYEFIRDKILVPAKGTLMNRLNTQFKLNIQRTGKGAERFFNVGHVQAVSEVQAGLALQSIKDGVKNIEMTRGVSNVAKSFLNFEILSQFTALGNPEFTKEFDQKVAYVRPQSEVGNATQSDYEGRLLNQVKNAIETVIKDNASWAEQNSSSNLIDAIAHDILASAKKGGATVQGLQKPNLAANKAKARIALDVKTVKVKAKLGATVESAGSLQPARSSLSLRSLIPMLNERLPEIVRKNMGQMGRLVNRTGRFAESTEIVDIGENAIISYSYMKNPYQTFENQGDRDPRPLIDLSIRELARGIITQKFATRRI